MWNTPQMASTSPLENDASLTSSEKIEQLIALAAEEASLDLPDPISRDRKEQNARREHASAQIETALNQTLREVRAELEQKPYEEEIQNWIKMYLNQYIQTETGKIIPLSIEVENLEGLSYEAQNEVIREHRIAINEIRRQYDWDIPKIAGETGNISREELNIIKGESLNPKKLEEKIDAIIDDILLPSLGGRKLQDLQQAKEIREGEIDLWAQLFLDPELQSKLFPEAWSNKERHGQKLIILDQIEDIHRDNGLEFLMNKMDCESAEYKTIQTFDEQLKSELENTTPDGLPEMERDHLFPQDLTTKIQTYLKQVLLADENKEKIKKMEIPLTFVIPRLMKRVRNCIQHPSNCVFTYLNNIKRNRLDARAFITIAQANNEHTLPEVERRLSLTEAPKDKEPPPPATPESCTYLVSIINRTQADTEAKSITALPNSNAIRIQYASETEASEALKVFKANLNLGRKAHLKFRLRGKNGVRPGTTDAMKQDLIIKIKQSLDEVTIQIFPGDPENIYADAPQGVPNDVEIQAKFIEQLLALESRGRIHRLMTGPYLPRS